MVNNAGDIPIVQSDVSNTYQNKPNMEIKKKSKGKTAIIFLTIVLALSFIISGSVLVASENSRSNSYSTNSSSNSTSTYKNLELGKYCYESSGYSSKKMYYKIYLTASEDHMLFLDDASLYTIVDNNKATVTTKVTSSGLYDKAYSFSTKSSGYYYITITANSSESIGIKVL